MIRISTAITPANIAKVLGLLESAPQRFEVATAQMGDAEFAELVEPGEWSVLEILAHLRSCEEVSTQRLYTLLAVDVPVLVAIHPHQWNKVMRYERQPFAQSFQVYKSRRRELLDVLRGLAAEKWARTGVLSGRRFTVYNAARNIALHEQAHGDHLDQILKSGQIQNW